MMLAHLICGFVPAVKLLSVREDPRRLYPATKLPSQLRFWRASCERDTVRKDDKIDCQSHAIGASNSAS